MQELLAASGPYFDLVVTLASIWCFVLGWRAYRTAAFAQAAMFFSLAALLKP